MSMNPFCEIALEVGAAAELGETLALQTLTVTATCMLFLFRAVIAVALQLI